VNPYIIKIDHFEGPFDLLLFFIERDELDIEDIPISKITDDFLDYIHQLEELNLDVASEFILVAATLMRIKAKMLIPRKELDSEGNEIDPRKELAQRLLEYKRFKDVIDDFTILEQKRNNQFHRGNAGDEIKNMAQSILAESELESLSLYGLLNAFKKAMDRFETEKNKPVHTVLKYNYTVESQQTWIRSKIFGGTRTSFDSIFQNLENRIHAIVTFLALLEMLNSHTIRIVAGEGANNFWVFERNEKEEE
jgi:segregation and condensation protein A